jgi:hypothetical protein
VNPAEIEQYRKLARAIIGRAVGDLTLSGAGYRKQAQEWLFDDMDEETVRWRDLLFHLADMNLQRLQATVREAIGSGDTPNIDRLYALIEGPRFMPARKPRVSAPPPPPEQCRYGHDLTGDDLYVHPSRLGTYGCKVCNRAAHKRRYALKQLQRKHKEMQ